MIWIVFAIAAWIAGWTANVWLARRDLGPRGRLLIPLVFGLSLIAVWEGIVRGFAISPVLLPAPSAIAVTFAASTAILWEDFVQTALKGALTLSLIHI